MPHETQQPAEIERDLARERDHLAETLEELRDRMSFEGAWKRAGRHLRENGSGYSQTFGTMVREKPLAVALTTIGLTWLIFGPATRSSSDRNVADRRWQPRSVDADPGGAMPTTGRAARTSPGSAHEAETGASVGGKTPYSSDRDGASRSAADDSMDRPSGLPPAAADSVSGRQDDQAHLETPPARSSIESERKDLSKTSVPGRTASTRPEGSDNHKNDRNEASS